MRQLLKTEIRLHHVMVPEPDCTLATGCTDCYWQAL